MVNCSKQYFIHMHDEKKILHNKQLQINSASVCVSMQMKKNSIVFTALQLICEKKKLFMALGSLDLRQACGV